MSTNPGITSKVVKPLMTTSELSSNHVELIEYFGNSWNSVLLQNPRPAFYVADVKAATSIEYIKKSKKKPKWRKLDIAA